MNESRPSPGVDHPLTIVRIGKVGDAVHGPVPRMLALHVAVAGLADPPSRSRLGFFLAASIVLAVDASLFGPESQEELRQSLHIGSYLIAARIGAEKFENFKAKHLSAANFEFGGVPAAALIAEPPGFPPAWIGAAGVDLV